MSKTGVRGPALGRAGWLLLVEEGERRCAAMEALILVAKSGGPTMFARIGVMRALNHGKPKWPKMNQSVA